AYWSWSRPDERALPLASVWHLVLWHSAPFGTWHFGTQLRLALGTLALSSVWHLALWHSAPFGTWHFGTQLLLSLVSFAVSSFCHLAFRYSLSIESYLCCRQDLHDLRDRTVTE